MWVKNNSCVFQAVKKRPTSVQKQQSLRKPQVSSREVALDRESCVIVQLQPNTVTHVFHVLPPVL